MSLVSAVADKLQESNLSMPCLDVLSTCKVQTGKNFRASLFRGFLGISWEASSTATGASSYITGTVSGSD